MIKIKNKNADDSEIVEPNMIPMIDTFLFLLLFFLLTAGVSQSLFDINIPRSDPAYRSLVIPPADKTEITLFADGRYAIGSNIVHHYDILKIKLSTIQMQNKNNMEHRYIITTDKAVSSERLMMLLSFMRAERMSNVDIVLNNER